MKILIPLVSSFGKAGGWRVISKLSNEWIKRGHEVYFLAPDDTDPYYPTYGQIFYYNYSGKIISKNKIKYKRKTLVGPLENRWKLHKAIDSFPIHVDVLLATNNFTAGPVAKSKLKSQKFYYIQAYEPEFYEQGPSWFKIYREIARRSYLKNLKMIVNADMYKDYKEVKTERVVYPGLDLELFHPVKREKDANKFILGTIGRIEAIKGTSYILESFEKLREKLGDKIELHVAFGDPKWSEKEGVEMFFPDGDESLAKFYQSLDTYISAGLFQLDAIHYPVIESMACKIPVITTGYYPSNEENSWKISPKSVEDIVERVVEVINNPIIATEKVEKAYREVAQFSWSEVANKMLDYFTKEIRKSE